MYKAAIGTKEFKIELESKKKSIDGKPFDPDVIEIRERKFHILSNNKSYSAEIVEVNHEEKTVIVKVNQNTYHVSVKDKYDELLQSMGLDLSNLKKGGDLKAPMPGLVLKVMVEPGQKIQKGDSILVLEAMKMENILKASADGEVKKILVKKGDKVEKNQVMVNLT